MPAFARFRIAALQELFRQLAYAPSEATRRHMDAAEKLLADIDPQHNYPEDFVVYRITGYRPEASQEPAVLVGSALVADLVNLVQRFSMMIELRAEDVARSPLTLEEVGRRLLVAPKTVQRYRRRGLVCHYLFTDSGARQLICFEDALDRFIQRHRAGVERAGRFTRVGPEDRQRMIDDALRMRQKENLTLNEAARRLAKTCGRARETVRLILRRHDRRAEKPIFASKGPLSARDLRVIDRAWCFGVPAAELARRFRCSRATIQRVISRARRRFLASLDLSYVELPTLELEDAASIILSNPIVCRDLDNLLPDDDALELIEALRGAPAHDENAEDALLAGYNFLKRRAMMAIADLPDWPGSRALDEIETDLRWAALLKRRLVDLALPAAVARINQNLHARLIDEPAERIIALLKIGIEVCSKVVEGIDPSRGQHLIALTSLATDRKLAGMETRAAGRAAARHAPGSIPLHGPFEKLTSWQGRLSLRRDRRRQIDQLDDRLRQAITLRFGLTGSPPLTFPQLAWQLDITPTAAARVVERGRAELRRFARQR
ncbi:MAG: hypothetical protein JSV91_07640 [Phycisphaerales bacterium]|nr:MAG: hypothetical protein JSV91_07640 [Phycisphaerales bacterium]